MPDFTVSNYIYLFCTSLFSHIFIIYIISANIILDCSWVVKVISVILAILSNPAMVFIPVTSVQIHKGLAADIMYRKSCMEGYLLKSKRNVETIVIFQEEENNIDKEHLQFKDARSSLDMETRSYALFDIWNILNQRPQIKNTGK